MESICRRRKGVICHELLPQIFPEFLGCSMHSEASRSINIEVGAFSEAGPYRIQQHRDDSLGVISRLLIPVLLEHATNRDTRTVYLSGLRFPRYDLWVGQRSAYGDPAPKFVASCQQPGLGRC